MKDDPVGGRGRTYLPDKGLGEMMAGNVIMLVLVLVGAIALGSFIVHRQPDVYRVRSVVSVRGPMAFEEMRDATPRLEEKMHRLRVHLTSKPTLVEVARETGLFVHYRGLGPEEVAELFRDHMHMEEEGERAWSLSLRGRDPERITLALNGLVDRVVEGARQEEEGDRHNMVQYLQGQMGGLQEQIGELNKRIERYKRENAGSLPEEVEANLAMIAQQSELLMFSAAGELGRGGREDVRAYEGVEAGALARYAETSTRYRAAHPDLPRSSRVLEIIRDYRRQAAAEQSNPWEDEFGEQAARRIAELESRLERVPEVGERFMLLLGEREGLGVRREGLQARLDEAVLRERLMAGTVGAPYVVIEEARTPLIADGPNRPLLYGVAVLMSIILAILAVTFREMITGFLRRRSSLEA